MPTKLNQTLDNLSGGVSRRPQEQRSSNQVQDQLNLLSLLGTRRVSRRPPLEHIAKLLTATDGWDSARAKVIRRSATEQYLMLLIDANVRVFDLATGAEITVEKPDGTTYLVSAADGYRFVTIGDHTVIVNRSTVTRRGTEQADASVKEALLYVRQGDFDTNYVVTLNDNTVTYTTPTTGRDLIATDVIAEGILDDLVAIDAIADNFTITRYGSTLHIVKTADDSVDFTLTAQDGLGDLALVAIKGSVQRFTDLPLKAVPGFVVEVKGDDTTKFDNYFVQYQEGDTPDEAGTWREVAEPGSIIAFDKSTMPHTLAYQGFYLDEDVEACPAPVPPTISGTSTQIIVSTDPDDTYAPGASITLDVESASFVLNDTYTNTGSGFMSSEDMLEGLRLLIEARAPDWVVSNVTAQSFRLRDSGTTALVSISEADYDFTTRFANSDLAWTVNEHATRTIRNLTDGSSAVISSNTAVALVTTAALTGGADNRFDPGDLCNIVGTGTYFTFRRIPYARREAGSLTTVPFPSFIDKAIIDVFEHQGRLGFLSGPNVILSRAGSSQIANPLFNFFRKTATQVLADDVIDAKSAVSQAPVFDSAVNWNGALLLKSDKGLFEMRGEPVFAPSTVSMKPIGDYESNPAFAPAVLGSSAFFLAFRSGLTQLLDFRVRGPEQVATADDVTEHVPGYIEGTPVQIEADDTHGLLYLRTDIGGDRPHIYVYGTQYFGAQRAQASWSKWTVSSESDIVSVLASQGNLYVITKDAGGIWLHSAMIAHENNPAKRSSGPGYVFLDRLVTQDTSGVSVAFAAGTTTWTLPYSVSAAQGTVRVVVNTGSALEAPFPSRPADNQVSVAGDYSAADVFIGVAYESRLDLSRIHRRGQEDVADTRGKLILRSAIVRYDDSTGFTAIVTDARTEADKSYVRIHADPTDGELPFPIKADTKHITVAFGTDAYGPMNISSVSWEGEQHDNRGSR